MSGTDVNSKTMPYFSEAGFRHFKEHRGGECAVECDGSYCDESLSGLFQWDFFLSIGEALEFT